MNCFAYTRANVLISEVKKVRTMLPIKPAAVALLVTLALAACDSAEERANEHYQRGLELIEAGDFDRAIVEFRNVFQIDGGHREARLRLAELLLTHRNNPQGAYSHYLRLVEQYPDDLQARLELSELAFLARNWDEVDRHGAKAEEIAPEDERVKVITLARAYRNAAIDENAAERRKQADAADQLLKSVSDSPILRNVLIDSYLRDSEYGKALAQLDWLLERDEKNILYWRQRLEVLSRLGDSSEIEAQLMKMVELFPDDAGNKLTLIRFYMSREEVDKAEGFLRQLIADADDDQPGPRLDLIRFLAEVRGNDAARKEIEAAIAAVPDPTAFRVVGASIDFTEGDQEKAVNTLEDVLKTAEPSDQTRAIKVSLAQMLLGMGNEVGARARVEEVLAEDDRNASALKMQANWLIDSDETDGAIASLRIAIEEEPEDEQALGLMARAYTRAGRPELARDYLALAVDASNNAPAQTIVYARILMSEERYLPAEDILKKSLRLNQNNVDLLVAMGQVYIRMEDRSRVEQIVRSLRSIGTSIASTAANGLEAELINQSAGPEEAMDFLETMATGADATLATRVALVRARLSSGDRQGALDIAREIYSENSDNIALRAVLGAAEAVNGNLEEAEGHYRAILEEAPQQPNIWLALAQLKGRQGFAEEARQVIEEGLSHSPESGNLLWAKASYLERQEDFEGAISIYEELYEIDSNSVVVANNLASMLTTYREDADSLERAYRISRRFRDTQLPALQDTYGWIEHRRGNSEEALPYLESAAQGLPQDPIVQYHLGQVYLAVGRQEDALAQFVKTIEVATPSDNRSQIADARKQIEALQSEGN
jgi:tetratricopeptide (TPR) repeat protein